MAQPASPPGRADASGSGGCWPPSCSCHCAAGLLATPTPAGGLDAGLARGLLLVCAPAGFGKTALLADWVRAGRRPVAWLSLDQSDNDPTRFWRHVVAALDRAQPAVAERVVPLLGPPPPSFEGLVSALINQLAAGPDGARWYWSWTTTT